MERSAGPAFTGLLAVIGIDGREARHDTVFIDRLWRSVEYQEVGLRAYDSLGHARDSPGRYPELWNRKRRTLALTPTSTIALTAMASCQRRRAA